MKAGIHFHCQSGPLQGTVFTCPPGGRLSFGRHPSCDIVLDRDPEVSREHACISFHTHTELEDLKSTNGIEVNDQEVLKHHLRQGDRFLIGTTTFHVDQVVLGSETRLPDSKESMISTLLNLQRILVEEKGDIITSALEATFEVLPASRLAVLKKNDGGFEVTHLVCQQGSDGEGLSSTFASKVWESGEALLMESADELDAEDWGSTMARHSVRSIVGVPFHDERGEPFGVLLGDNQANPNALKKRHVDLLRFLGRSLETVFQKVHMDELEVAQQKVASAMQLTQKVQSQLFRNPPSGQHGPYHFEITYQPAQEIGGDYYGLRQHEDRYVWTVADVCGKGVPAALIVSMLKGASNILVERGQSPSQLLQDLHRVLQRDTPRSMFATCFTLDLQNDGTLRYGNAGHTPALLHRADGAEPETLGRTGNPLFISPSLSQPFQEKTLQLRPGDCLLVYTDGVTEAMDAEQNFYGDERLLETFQRTTHLDPAQQLQAIRRDVEEHEGEDHQADNTTILLIEYRP